VQKSQNKTENKDDNQISSSTAKKSSNFDPYGGYGDEDGEGDDAYGDYGDYGMEGMDDFGMMGDFGANFKDMNLDSQTSFEGNKKDEHYLLSHLLQDIDVVKHISSALKNVGP